MAKARVISVFISLLALILSTNALAQTVGPANAILCNRSFQVSAGATAITQFIAAVTGQFVYVCGYDLNAGAAAGTFQLSTGTGSNCGTGTAALTPAFSLGVNGVLVSRSPYVGLSTPVSQALCYTITGTGPVNALVYWGQF